MHTLSFGGAHLRVLQGMLHNTLGDGILRPQSCHLPLSDGKSEVHGGIQG